MLGKLFSKKQKVTCPQCSGEKTTMCVHCGGSGMMSIPNISQMCNYCGQTGKETCSLCKGKGEIYR